MTDPTPTPTPPTDRPETSNAEPRTYLAYDQRISRLLDALTHAVVQETLRRCGPPHDLHAQPCVIAASLLGNIEIHACEIMPDIVMGKIDAMYPEEDAS